MSRRAWRRATALILGWTAAVTLVYSGYVPAPVLDDVVWSGVGFVLKPFWVAVAAVELAAAIGVLRRYRWARLVAILLGAWLVANGVIGFIGPLAVGALPNPFALIGVAMGILVLYAMAARWHPRRPPGAPALERDGSPGVPPDPG